MISTKTGLFSRRQKYAQKTKALCLIGLLTLDVLTGGKCLRLPINFDENAEYGFFKGKLNPFQRFDFTQMKFIIRIGRM